MFWFPLPFTGEGKIIPSNSFVFNLNTLQVMSGKKFGNVVNLPQVIFI